MTMPRASGLSMLALAVAATLAGGACKKERWPGLDSQAPASGTQAGPGPTQADVPPPPLPPRDVASWKHPRILLTPERVNALMALQRANAPTWQALLQVCNDRVNGTSESGYEGEDWAYGTLALALCWHVNPGRTEYARAAGKYLVALMDDNERVGDHRGGDRIIERNDGYGIRNHGFLAAVAFDWLYPSGEITPDVKKKVIGRVANFLKWYRKDGYKRDDAISNHYMGHFGTAAAAGLAFDGEDPKGAEIRALARHMWKNEVIRDFAKLSGGDFAEGWQYARTVIASIAVYIEGESRAPGGNPKIADELPWFKESVAFQTHALLPDGVHCFDNADWSRKPARPPSMQLMLTSLALPRDPAGSRALWLGRKAMQPDHTFWQWADALGDDPNNPGEDPRKGPTAHFARGTGTVMARTDWTDKAAWVSLTAAPFMSDHQHLDQGHFEVVRGADPLIIDPGDYDSYSTMSHNSILVDDRKDAMRFSPNQGAWGKDIAVRQYQDAQGVTYALADFGHAYDADPDEKKPRSVPRAEREWIFSRAPVPGMAGPSARLVLYDRVTVAKPSYGVVWTGHASVTPKVNASTTSVTVGASQAIVKVLVPPGATQKLLTEPTIRTNDIFMQNTPAEGIRSTRFETESPKGATERRFLHAIAIGNAGDAPPLTFRVEGEGADGAVIADEAYVFPEAGPHKAPAGFSYKPPSNLARHIVVGLAPNGAYTFNGNKDGQGCKIVVGAGGATKASPAGVVILSAKDCAVK
jgi:hypothetical protein